MTIYTAVHVYCNFCSISEEKFTMFKQLLIKPILIFKNPLSCLSANKCTHPLTFKNCFNHDEFSSICCIYLYSTMLKDGMASYL